MSFLKSRAFKVLVSLALAGGLVLLLLRQVNPAEVGRRIAAASGPWLWASAALAVLTYVLRAWRWIWILRPAGRVGFGPSFYATAVGFAGNFLPARAGEIIRPAILSRDTGLPFSTLLASILIERLFDAASVFFFLGLAMLDRPWARVPGASGAPVAIGVLPLVALAGILVVSYLAIFQRRVLERVFDGLLHLFPSRFRVPARAAASAFLDGFGLVKKLSSIEWIAVMGSSLFMWFVINLQIGCVVNAFALDLPLSATYVLTFAAVLGLAVPTPAGIGGYHAAVAGALMRFGVSADAALGAATVSHAVSFVPISLIGLGMLVVRSLGARAPEPL
jgi:glycosyltransferase 2 family protein